ncbi:hypothetical protein ACE10W_05155 [Bradyrhizobium sp. B025]|uniref:hypothetical protein n=1 Tax=Bradyrhizobium sp. B025 TaxID=3344829 RepID=UPI0035D470D0
MAGFIQDWRIELISTYPELFHPVGDPRRGEGMPYVDDGWRDLLDRMCVRILTAVRADGGTFKFTQIKEKYGTLRVYWDGALSPDADARVEEAITLAEARSACTCDVCGEEGRLRDGAWLATRCVAHAEGLTPVERRLGFENVYLVRHFADGRHFVTYRRYDRQNDVFIDVDPATLGIEED